MPRVRDPNRDRAFEIYMESGGEIDLVEIASQLSVSAGTVRGWKFKDKWEEHLNGTFQTKDTERSKHPEEKKEIKNKAGVKEVEEVLQNTELTDKQQLFCIYYVRSFNATKSYQKAYGCSYENAMVEGSKTLRNPKVKEEVFRLKKERLNREFLSESDIFQKYMDIAFADITDYLEFGTEEVPVMAMYGPVEIKDPKTGKKRQLTKIVNVVRFKNSCEIDGSILAEVKQGKDGASLKLADRMKALQWLSDHMDLATEKQRAEIAVLKSKIQNDDDVGSDGDELVIYIPDNGRQDDVQAVEIENTELITDKPTETGENDGNEGN